MMLNKLAISVALACSLTSISAQALELTLSSNAKEIPQAQIKEAIVSSLPATVSQLGSQYKLFAVVETADYKEDQRLYSYSVMLHRQVIEAVTGKIYWVPTGGIRSHGVAVTRETVLTNLKGDVIAGAEAGSFRLDQE